MGFIDRVSNSLFGGDKEHGAFSNQSLVNKAVACFREGLRTSSLRKRLIYDMNFLILVPHKEYDRVADRFSPIVKEMVEGFYEVIQQERMAEPPSLLPRLFSRGKSAETGVMRDYHPLSEYWTFRVAPNDQLEGGDDDGILIIGQATAERTWGDTLVRDADIGSVTINGKRTAYNRFNFNPQMFDGIDTLERGCVRLAFSMELRLDGQTLVSMGKSSTSAGQPSSIQIETAGTPLSSATKDKDALALLSFSDQGGSKEYHMRNSNLSIGRKQGANDRTSLERLAIETGDEALAIEHFRLSYDPVARRLRLAVFAPARLDGIHIGSISRPEAPEWIDLKQNNVLSYGIGHIRITAL